MNDQHHPGEGVNRWGLAAPAGDTVDLFILSARTEPSWKTWLASQAPERKRWLQACQFDASVGQVVALPASDGSLAGAVIGLGELDLADPFAYVNVVARLPAAVYAVKPVPARAVAEALALGWALATRRRHTGALARLVWPTHEATDELAWMIEAEVDARHWIETPACDLSPSDLVEMGRAQFVHLGGTCRVLKGGELLESGYPGVFHVGKGSGRSPALLDATWGPARAPKVTLVGKGVCFDAGGVNIKGFGDMAHMKSDMAGAAQALALARLLIKVRAPIRLRLLIPAADMPSGTASMPGDVIRTRKGISIEIVHTDYEGRVLLADALSAASEEKPDLLIDFSTLTDTGLGPALAGFFTDDEILAGDLLHAASRIHDPVWRLPLWRAYAERVRSPVADLSNRESEGTPMASIAAALFLAPFASGSKRWVHFDFNSWTAPAMSLRPGGANVVGLRATYALIRELYG